MSSCQKDVNCKKNQTPRLWRSTKKIDIMRFSHVDVNFDVTHDGHPQNVNRNYFWPQHKALILTLFVNEPLDRVLCWEHLNTAYHNQTCLHCPCALAPSLPYNLLPLCHPTLVALHPPTHVPSNWNVFVCSLIMVQFSIRLDCWNHLILLYSTVLKALAQWCPCALMPFTSYNWIEEVEIILTFQADWKSDHC